MDGIFECGKAPALRLSCGIKKNPLIGRLSDERGIALIIVLWVMAFLMFVVVEFAYTMRVETDTVRNLKDETAARYLALSGINMGLAELSAKYDVVFLDKNGKLELGVKEGNDLTSLDVKREFAMGDGSVKYSVTDEAGKLNLNTAERQQIAELLRLTGVERVERDTIADSILDWRDKDHSFHFNGAEDDYYGGLRNPYGAMDGPFEAIGELLLVKGVTPEIFYGTGKVPPEYGLQTAAAGLKSGHEYAGLLPYITVSGNGKVNLNTAPPTVLDAMLGKGRSMEIALRRETEGYLNWPVYGGAVTSEVFSIRSEGEVRGMKYAIEAIAMRAVDDPEARVIYWNDNALPLN